MGFEGIGRVDVDERVAGDLFVVAGFPEVEIGDTIADPAHPEAAAPPQRRRARAAHDLRREHLAAGRQGGHATSPPATCASASTARCSATCRSASTDTDSPDVIEVAGRGELQLGGAHRERCAARATSCRSAGPRSSSREIDGKRHEPLERAVIDVPDEHVGTVTQALAPRKGKVTDLRPGDTGRTIVTLRGARPAASSASARQLLTATRGTALHAPAPRRLDAVGRRPAHPQGRRHARRPHRHHHRLRPRQPPGRAASCSSAPARTVYEGMVVGENARPDDMNVNVVREKQKTNIRTHAADEAIKLTPPREHHARDGHRVHRRRRAGRGHARPTLRVRKRVLKEQDRRRLKR